MLGSHTELVSKHDVTVKEKMCEIGHVCIRVRRGWVDVELIISKPVSPGELFESDKRHQ
jgi:hypothetical protein